MIGKKQVKKAMLALVLSVSVFAAGCGKAPDVDISEAVTTAAATEEVTTEATTTAVTTEEITTEPEEVAFDWSPYSVRKKDNIYKLNDFIRKDGYKLLTYAVRSENEVCFIYLDEAFRKELVLVTLDLETGKKEVLSKLKYVRTRHDASEEMGDDDFVEMMEVPMPYLKTLSANPLRLYDYSNRIVYTPEEAVKYWELPEEMWDADIFEYDGQIYGCLNSNALYQISRDSAEKVFSLPNGFSYMYKLSGYDETGLIMVTNTGEDLMNGDWSNKYIEIDPSDWSYKSYRFEDDYYGENRIGNYRVEMEYVMPDFETENPSEDCILKVCDYERGQSYSISKKYVLEKTEDTFITYGDCVVAGNSFIFETMSYEGSGEDYYFWNLENESGSAWKSPERQYFEVKVRDESIWGCRRMAEEMMEEYGVSIYIGDDIQKDTGSYLIEPNNNVAEIYAGLSTLKQGLSLYPENFFRELMDGYLYDIIFYLTGHMTPTDPMQNIEGPAGLAWNDNGYRKLFLLIDDNMLSISTVVHEITHMVDGKLMNAGELYDWDWNQLNPEDFSYYYGYIDEDGVSYQFSGSEIYTSMNDAAWFMGDYSDVYFIDSYAKTWPTEDRARIMENLFGIGETNPCFMGNNIRRKAWIYSEMIRNVFNSSEWKEPPIWEQRLLEFDLAAGADRFQSVMEEEYDY